MDRDPLALDPSVSADLDSFNESHLVKSKDDLVVERYNPDIKVGLSNEDVESRIMAGLSNLLDTGSSKVFPLLSLRIYSLFLIFLTFQSLFGY